MVKGFQRLEQKFLCHFKAGCRPLAQCAAERSANGNRVKMSRNRRKLLALSVSAPIFSPVKTFLSVTAVAPERLIRVSFQAFWPTGSSLLPCIREKQRRGTTTMAASDFVLRTNAHTCSAC